MTHKDINAAAIAAARAMIFDSVGYGQPPKASQFRKGQSGNPKGRPRKTPDPVFDASGTSPGANAAAMQRVLAEPVRLRDGGKLRKVSKAEALQRVREKKALTGESVLASRDLHRQLLEQDARARQAIIDDHAFWRHYLERRAADLAQARAAGTSPSQFWVEPEDITFPPNAPVEVRGPVTAEQVPTFAELELLRDALIAEAIYFGHYHGTASSDGRISMAAPMAGLIDRQLTLRQVRTGQAYWSDIMDKCRWRFDLLREERKCAWRKYSIKVPNSPILPAMPQGMQDEFEAKRAASIPLAQRIHDAIDKGLKTKAKKRRARKEPKLDEG